MENKLPKLDGEFFNVVQVAIENTAWKRADFDKVAKVEGQLKALSFFYRDYYVAEKIKAEAAQANANIELAKKAAEAKGAIAGPEKVAPVEIDIPAIEPGVGIKVEDVNELLAPPKTVVADPGVVKETAKVPVEETPMPDSIAQIVKDRVAAAKKVKPVNKNIKVSESILPDDVDDYIKLP